MNPQQGVAPVAVPNDQALIKGDLLTSAGVGQVHAESTPADLSQHHLWPPAAPSPKPSPDTQDTLAGQVQDERKHLAPRKA